MIVSLYDECSLMNDLRDHTVDLIHCTRIFEAIKKLVSAYEIINLNLDIQSRFATDEPTWDAASLQDLRSIKTSLLVFHHGDFKPFVTLKTYGAKMDCLLHSISVRLAR